MFSKWSKNDWSKNRKVKIIFDLLSRNPNFEPWITCSNLNSCEFGWEPSVVLCDILRTNNWLRLTAVLFLNLCSNFVVFFCLLYKNCFRRLQSFSVDFSSTEKAKNLVLFSGLVSFFRLFLFESNIAPSRARHARPISVQHSPGLVQSACFSKSGVAWTAQNEPPARMKMNSTFFRDFFSISKWLLGRICRASW